LSVLIISEANKSDGSIGLPRYSIINNLIQDTLFIKVLPLLPSSSPDFTTTALTPAVGVTIQWRFTNLNGDKTISVANQKTQWNHGMLQLPFATRGLGRTNNYIEDLTVGYSGNGIQNSWTPVIPNSQLILVPQQ
jgi:integrin alpha FG-GAP repeat containing protein 1